MKFSEGVKLVPIWGDSIPGNTGKSKSDIMDIDKSLTMEDVFTRLPGVWDKSTPVLGDMRGNDYLVWLQEMQEGYAKETYDDVPMLAEFIVPGSDKAVILCPGGAYLSKSVQSEGEQIAKYLNEQGISAFVLWYRTYPYHAPYMFLDLQRAIRFVRAHAEQYGLRPDKIATAGFSAGGNLVGVEALCFRDAPVDIPGYTPDAVDALSGAPNAIGLVYPAVALADDKATACIAGAEVYNDEERRQAFSDQYDMRTHVQPGDCPAFLCNCFDDDVLPPTRLAELAAVYKAQGVDCELHQFAIGGHGFGACQPEPDSPFPLPDRSAVRQWMPLFVSFITRYL